MSQEAVTVATLQKMKQEGKKSAGVVAWDYPTTRFAEMAGADFVSIGDSVGANLWGHTNPLQVTLDAILVCCRFNFMNRQSLGHGLDPDGVDPKARAQKMSYAQPT